MSEIDENQILRNLERLSQVEPNPQASGRAVQKAREALVADKERMAGLGRPSLVVRLTKLAAAAVLLIGAGYIVGRVSAPEPLDVSELRAALESSLRSSLEPAIREALLDEIDSRWQSVFATGHTQLQQQVGRDLAELAQTLAASRSLTDQRFRELIQSIEAARRQDRLRTAAALEQIELNRLQDKTRFGNDLVALAAQANELLGTEHN